MDHRHRVVCWFSCGAASAVATMLTIRGCVGFQPVVARIVLDSEHPDNDRFAADCEQWFGVPIVNLRSNKYRDTWDVYDRTRWLNGPSGARCTVELKKKVREDFQEPDDVQVFGYHYGEVDRAEDFRRTNFDLTLEYPLIKYRLDKHDCKRMVTEAGILLPYLYRQGYENNNCIGCVKGGAGYWNKIRVDYPEVFARMAEQERRLGAHLIKLSGGRVSLDELPPDVGNYGDEDMTCGPLCGIQQSFGLTEIVLANKD